MFNYENEYVDIEKNDVSELNAENMSQKNDQDGQCVDQLRHCQEELGVVKERFARLTADFQNYKKRAESDRIMMMDRSRSDVLYGILSVVDNFDRAMEEAQANKTDALQQWLAGFELIHKGLYDFLAAQKVTPITQVQTFDPSLHEAIARVDVPDYRSGDVVKVFEKGFMYKDAVLRTAKVSVAA